MSTRAERLKKLKRGGALVLPSLFTLSNMAFGFFAILKASDGQFAMAASLIFLGMVMDGLDGKVARLVHGESAFGIEFDSLADFLAFCVAPGYVLYQLLLKDIPVWGAVVAFFYALCGGLRLARFNVSARDATGSKTHFMGLPTPAGAGVLASFVLLYDIIESGRPARTLAPLMDFLPTLYAAFPFVMAGVGLLMVSKVPYRAFKQGVRPGSVKSLLAVFLLLCLLYAYPQTTLFLFFASYLVSGLAAWLWRGVQRKSSRAPEGAPKHQQA